MLAGLIDSGWALYLALVILCVEAAIYLMAGAQRGRRFVMTGLANIAAGGFLLLALNAALNEASGRTVAVFLLAGGLCHLADALLRFRR